MSIHIVLDTKNEVERCTTVFDSRNWCDRKEGSTIIGYESLEKQFAPESVIGVSVRGYQQATGYHVNYLEYLAYCYGNHYTAIIRPDILWYVILSEMSLVVRSNVEVYRSVFTTSTDKLNIVIPDNNSLINLQMLLEYMKTLIPANIGIFLPKFSTADEYSQYACMSAFADAMSVYYNYWTLVCNIPEVIIEGTRDDWTKFIMHLELLQSIMIHGIPSDYFSKIISHIEYIRHMYDVHDVDHSEDHVEFFKKMFYTERCGSGSQYDIYGWITDFCVNQPPDQGEGSRKLSNFSKHVSKVQYYDITNNIAYQLNCGLFGSYADGNILIPQFGRVVFEIPVETFKKEQHISESTFQEMTDL